MTSCASCGTRQRALEPYGGDRAREGKVVGLQTPSRCAQTDLTTDTRWCAESKGANARGCRCFWPRSEEKKLAGSICTAPPHTHKPHISVHARACSSHFQYFATSPHATHMHTRCVSLAESAALSQRPNEDKRFHATKWPEYASSQ
jgi:hypothetical protein